MTCVQEELRALPPTGFHGFVSVGLSWTIPNKAAILGIIFGSMWPDADLFLAAATFLVTGSEQLTVSMHRTYTHSVLVIAGLAVLGALLFLARPLKKKPWGAFLLGLSLGACVHVGMDMFYIDGVGILWPISIEKLSPFGLSYTQFSEMTQKLLVVADFSFEAVWWIGFALLLRHQRVDTELSIGRFRISRIPLFLFIAGLGEAALMVLFLGLAFLIPDRNLFVFLIYIPGLAILLFSILLPLIFRRTYYSLAFPSIKGGISKDEKESKQELNPENPG